MILLASVFLLSIMVTGTYAWNTAADILNEFFGDSRSCTVVLEKYEKDIYGEITDKPIEGAVFSLYQIQERQVSVNETTFEEVLLEDGLCTDENGSIQIEKLAVGEYYFQEDSPIYLYTYDKDKYGEDIRKYAFEITADTLNSEGEVKVEAYNQRLTGQLLVRKTVKNKDDTELTAEQKAQEFTFEIIFSEEGEYTYTIDGGSEQELHNGTIILRHGEEALFTNLPAGMEYSVQEIPVAGYNIISNNHQGNILLEKSGSLLSEEEDNLEFPYGITEVDYINIWEEEITPEPDSVLVISKEVVAKDDNEEVDETEEFQFLVTIGNDKEQVYTYRKKSSKLPDSDDPIDSTEQSYTIKGSGIITLRHGECAVFENLPPGTFYKIEELPTEGYLALHESYSGQTLADEVTELPFVNYKDDIDRPETGQLTITKEITGDGTSEDDVFDFSITFLDKEGNILEQEYPYIKAGETLLMLDGWFDGTFWFHLQGGECIVFEDLPDGIGYIVSEEENQDGYEARLKEKSGRIIGGTEGSVLFRNHRDEETEEQVELIVRKKTTGKGADLEKAFTFTYETEDYTETFTLVNGQEKRFYVLKGTVYQVAEQDASTDGYLQTSVTNGYATAAGEQVVIEKTNTKLPDTIDPKPEPDKKVSLHVEKKWQKDNASVRPGNIRIQLYRNGEVYGSVITMNSEAGWNHTWSGLPDSYQWTVDELVIPDGYKKQVSGTIADGFTIINTYTRSLSGGGSEKEKPGGRISGGDETDDDSGGMSGTGEDSSQRNGDGKAASTGDDVNIWLWTILLVGSALAMKNIWFESRREKG